MLCTPHDHTDLHRLLPLTALVTRRDGSVGDRGVWDHAQRGQVLEHLQSLLPVALTRLLAHELGQA